MKLFQELGVSFLESIKTCTGINNNGIILKYYQNIHNTTPPDEEMYD